MKHRREEYSMSGRQIIDSFGKLNSTYQYQTIQDLPKDIQKKFHKCSSNVYFDFERRVKELEDKKLPYIVVARLEWFEPNEEVK
jgi:hypothetical protein